MGAAVAWAGVGAGRAALGGAGGAGRGGGGGEGRGGAGATGAMVSNVELPQLGQDACWPR